MNEEPALKWKRIKIAEICQIVANYHHLFMEELVGNSRPPVVVHARQQAFLLAHEKGKSSNEIGRVMHRDHSTVLWGKRRAVTYERENPTCARQLNELRNMIEEKIKQNAKDFGTSVHDRNSAVR